MTKNKYTPIFEKEGHQVAFLQPDLLADTPEEAHEIGWGFAFVEGILTDTKFSCQTGLVDFEANTIDGRAVTGGTIGPYLVAILEDKNETD